jgi:hypothetical protein
VVQKILAYTPPEGGGEAPDRGLTGLMVRLLKIEQRFREAFERVAHDLDEVLISLFPYAGCCGETVRRLGGGFMYTNNTVRLLGQIRGKIRRLLFIRRLLEENEEQVPVNDGAAAGSGGYDLLQTITVCVKMYIEIMLNLSHEFNAAVVTDLYRYAESECLVFLLPGQWFSALVTAHPSAVTR